MANHPLNHGQIPKTLNRGPPTRKTLNGHPERLRNGTKTINPEMNGHRRNIKIPRMPRNLNGIKMTNPKMNGLRRNTEKIPRIPSRGPPIRRRVENGINLRKRKLNGKRSPNHGLIPKITNHGRDTKI